MLHHISVAVDQPLHVAEVLAEILQGHSYPFPGHPGCYITLAYDEYGTAIELLPAGTELTPGQSATDFSPATPRLYNSVHVAVSVPTSQERIEQIAAREGWNVMVCDRGPFKVIEFWVENKFLVELLPPAFASVYTAFMQPANMEAFVAQASLANATA